MLAPPASKWFVADSKILYGIEGWSGGFYNVSESGETTVKVDQSNSVSLRSIFERINPSDGLFPPLVLRFPQILQERINTLLDGFGSAIANVGYQGVYHGLFPIKVNQSREIVQQIAKIGSGGNYGMEVGNRGELMAAMGCAQASKSRIVVNGYKDPEFVDLALNAQELGFDIVIVLETPDEIDLVLERAMILEVRPTLGVRLRLTSRPGGPWCKTNEIFGLTSAEIVSVIDRLKESGDLSLLKMVHFHQGSQLRKLEDIRVGIREGARIYAELFNEGAALDMLNVGGGLALNYDDGNGDHDHSGVDYDFAEYAHAIVSTVKEVLDLASVPHPILLSESGRAVCAQQSMLVFGLHNLSPYVPSTSLPADRAENLHEKLRLLFKEVGAADHTVFLDRRAAWSAQIESLFIDGEINLRERAAAETELRLAAVSLSEPGDRARMLEVHDIAYGNFSVFQSIPDHWGIDQKFPAMPLTQLDRRPDRLANVSDLTCDSDGRLNNGDDEPGSGLLPIHNLSDYSGYLIGIFLTGAYQESLGGMHNLFGKTCTYSVTLEGDEFTVSSTRPAQSNSEVLEAFNYDPQSLLEGIQNRASNAQKSGQISEERKLRILDGFERNLKSSSYLSGESL